TSAALFAEGARWGVHDPCFPSKLVLSHVDWLLRRAEPAIDVLFMPAITHARIAVRGTADTASCPIVAACGHTSVAALRRERDVLADQGAQRGDGRPPSAAVRRWRDAVAERSDRCDRGIL